MTDSVISSERFASIAEGLFAAAPGLDIEIVLDSTRSNLTRFAESRVSQNVTRTDSSASIRVIRDGASGKAGVNSFSPDMLKRALDRAVEVAEAQENGSVQPLAEPAEFAKVPSYFESTATIPFEAKGKIVGDAVRRCAGHGLTPAGRFHSEENAVGIATSNGLFAYDVSTMANFSVTALDSGRAGWAAADAYDVDRIDYDAVISTAIDKAISSADPVALEPGEHTVILEPQCATDFSLYMSMATFNGLAFAEGRSFLSDKLGQKVFGENITIVDDAYDELCYGLPFDFEGTPRERVVLIENGIAKGVCHDRVSAAKVGGRSTGHSLPQPNTDGVVPLNIVWGGGDSSLEEMISSTKRGVLVTQFHYTNILSPTTLELTGMTRNGTFLVEDGRVTKALKNMRFTQSIPEALNSVEALSRDRIYARTFWGGGYVVPAMKISGFKFSSATEF